MIVTLLAFSTARDFFGFAELKLELPTDSSSTIEALLDRIKPDWKTKLPRLRVALGFDFVPLSTLLMGGETIALIPPVSGG